MEDLGDLLPEVVAFDEEAIYPPPPEHLPVTGEDHSPLGAGDAHQVVIVQGGEVEGVIAQDAEPLGQPAQHGVHQELHSLIITGLWGKGEKVRR